MAHIVLTDGIRPVPCLIAGYRLCTFYRERDPEKDWPLIAPLCSEESIKDAERVMDKLAKLLGHEFDDNWRRFLITDVGDPVAIPKKAEQIARQFRKETGLFLYYTAGTEAMSVHKLQQLGECRRNAYEVDIRYLSPKKRRVMLPDGELQSAPDDERDEWKLTLEELAGLHSHEVESQRPSERNLPIAQQVLELVKEAEDGSRRQIREAADESRANDPMFGPVAAKKKSKISTHSFMKYLVSNLGPVWNTKASA